MPNLCSRPCLVPIFCKNRAQRQNIFSVTMISDGCGIFKRRVRNYCEKYFIIIITNSTHLRTLLTFNVEDDWDISLQTTSKTHLTPNYGVASLFKMLTYSPCMLRFFIDSRLVLERNLHF